MEYPRRTWGNEPPSILTCADPWPLQTSPSAGITCILATPPPCCPSPDINILLTFVTLAFVTDRPSHHLSSLLECVVSVGAQHEALGTETCHPDHRYHTPFTSTTITTTLKHPHVVFTITSTTTVTPASTNLFISITINSLLLIHFPPLIHHPSIKVIDDPSHPPPPFPPLPPNVSHAHPPLSTTTARPITTPPHQFPLHHLPSQHHSATLASSLFLTYEP